MRKNITAGMFLPVLCLFLVYCGGADYAGDAFMRHNRALDRRTEIKKSNIPNAGMGVFALQDIGEGEIIGEYGGRLMTEQDDADDERYVAILPECAIKKLEPYRYIDGKDSEAHVTRINFAPMRINGKETDLQNAVYDYVCRPPYMYFKATRDIKKGEEIYADYGPNYDYGFMKDKGIKAYFCGLLDIDCSVNFDFEY